MYIYILTNAHGTLYIGVTSDLPSRLQSHADTSSNTFAHRYNCDRLIYTEHHENAEDAIAREKQLKTWRRAKKVRLIATVNPHWKTIDIG